MTEIRVVLDTNLFIATYWNRSTASAKIIQACIDKKLTAFYTAEMSRELDIILRNIRAKPEYIDFVQRFRESAHKLSDVPAAEYKTVDPEDQKFIDCAVTAGADYLITSDDHLLSLHDLGRTLVVKPSVFWREIAWKLQSSLRK